MSEVDTMNLQLASNWLERGSVGFSDIHQFAVQCRDASVPPNRESAAMMLLAQAAVTFAERQEGTAVSKEVVLEFLVHLHADAVRLRDASSTSDAALIAELNHFAARLAKDFCI